MAGETYLKRYASGFLNADSSRPADDVFLNRVETALLRLLGQDPTDAQAWVWDAALGRFKSTLLTNAHISGTAAIARSKLDFGTGLVNADIAAAAAIARSKLDFGAGLVNADIAAGAAIAASKIAGGAKVTTSAFSGGPPASPADADIWVATGVDATGTRWMFQYNAGSASAFKWEFIGGPPTTSYVDTSEGTTSGTYVALTTPHTIVITRQGDYDIEIGCNASAGTQGVYSYDVGATAALDVDGAGAFGGTLGQGVSNTRRKTGIAAATTLTAKAKSAGASASAFSSRRFRVWPVRII